MLNLSLKKALRYGLSFALMGLFLYWAFQGIEVELLWRAIEGTPASWILIILGTTLCTVALRAWRWVVLMRPFTRDVTVLDASLALCICYTGNFVLPRAGEVLRALSLRWRRGVSIGSVLGTVVVERILDMFWLLFFVGAAILIARDKIRIAYPWMEPGAVIVLSVCLLLMLLLVTISIYRERALRLVHSILSRISPRLAQTVGRLLETFVQGLEALHTPSAYLEVFASSVLLNAGYLLIIYESFIAFDLHREPLNLGLSASVVTLAISSLGMVVPAAGGIGSYHFFFAESLQVLYEVPAAAALACATVTHATANALYIAIGGPAFFIQRAAGRRSAAGVP